MVARFYDVLFAKINSKDEELHTARGFGENFCPDKAEADGNTLCIGKVENEVRAKIGPKPPLL